MRLTKGVRAWAIILGVAAILGGGLSPAQAGQRGVRISAARAKRIAINSYPGKVVNGPTLRKVRGHWEYALTIRSGKVTQRVRVNANNGKVSQVASRIR